MQIVEEEFKHTAAKLGVTGPEASALAHQWASPEATGLPMTPNDALEDSAHQEQLHRPHHYGNHPFTKTSSQGTNAFLLSPGVAEFRFPM